MSLHYNRTHGRGHAIDPLITWAWPPRGGGSGGPNAAPRGYRTGSVTVNLAGDFGGNQFSFLWPWTFGCCLFKVSLKANFNFNFTCNSRKLNYKEWIYNLGSCWILSLIVKKNTRICCFLTIFALDWAILERVADLDPWLVMTFGAGTSCLGQDE